VLFLLYLNIVLSSPEEGRLRPKHVATYNLILIIESCLDVCCVLTEHNILYKCNFIAGRFRDFTCTRQHGDSE